MTRREFTLTMLCAALFWIAVALHVEAASIEASTRRHANLRCYSDDAYESAGLEKPVADWARYCWTVLQ